MICKRSILKETSSSYGVAMKCNMAIIFNCYLIFCTSVHSSKSTSAMSKVQVQSRSIGGLKRTLSRPETSLGRLLIQDVQSTTILHIAACFHPILFHTGTTITFNKAGTNSSNIDLPLSSSELS